MRRRHGNSWWARRRSHAWFIITITVVTTIIYINAFGEWRTQPQPPSSPPPQPSSIDLNRRVEELERELDAITAAAATAAATVAPVSSSPPQRDIPRPTVAGDDGDGDDDEEMWPEYAPPPPPPPPSSSSTGMVVRQSGGISRKVYPHSVDSDVLCVVPNMNTTTYFVNKTKHIATCDEDQHYSFTKWRQDNTIEIVDCDGRVYYVTNDGMLSQTERKARGPLIHIDVGVEQVLVTCQTQDGVASYDLYTRVQRNKLAYERAKRLTHKFRVRKEFWMNDVQNGGRSKAKDDVKADINLIILVVDSLSRANFLRSLPKTVNFLDNLAKHTRGAYTVYDFQLFNIVGSGTYENAPPILTGTPYNDDWQAHQMLQLPLSQGNLTKRAYDNLSATTLPSIWDVFHHYGGVTAYLEEGCIRNTGAIPRVWRHKVKKDLSWGETFSFKRTAGRMMDHAFYNIWCDIMEKMSVGDFFSLHTRRKLCFAGRHIHEYTLEYIEQFMATYPGVSRFSMAMMAQAHEGSTRRVRTLDNALVTFLERITIRYPNTMVAVLGDHGLGYGGFSKTPAGKLEYKLPALYMMIPSFVLANHPEYAANIERNQRRLVTGYDVYHTLVHLKSLRDPQHDEQYRLSLMPKKERQDFIALNGTDMVNRMGASLLYPVSVNRTCKDMDIPMEYCSCTNYHTVENANSDQYRLLSDLAIHHMNLKAHTYPPATTSCSQLYLGAVEQVQIATVSQSAEEQLVLTFTNKPIPEKHLSSETFEALLHRRNVSVLVNTSRILTMELGANYQTDKKIFAGDSYVLPTDVGTVWCVNRWKTTENPDETKFDVIWMQPHGTDGKGPPTIFTTTTVSIDKTWVLAWQPLVHTEPLMTGQWTVKVVVSKTQQVIGTSSFFVMGREYPGIPIVTLYKYWHVKNVKRLSAYETHRTCADPAQPLEYCVCDTNAAAAAAVNQMLAHVSMHAQS